MRNKLSLSLLLSMCSIIHAPYADVTIGTDKGEFYYIVCKALTSMYEDAYHSCVKASDLFEQRKDSANAILSRIEKHNKENPTATLWLNPADVCNKNTFVLETLCDYMDKSPETVYKGPHKFICDVLSNISEDDKKAMQRAHELFNSYKSGTKPIEQTPDLEEFIELFKRLGFGKHEALYHLAKNSYDDALAIIKTFDKHEDIVEFLDFIIKRIGLYCRSCKRLERVLLAILNSPDKQEFMLQYAAKELKNYLDTMLDSTFPLISKFFYEWCKHHEQTLSEQNNPVTKFTIDLASALNEVYRMYSRSYPWFEPLLAHVMKKCAPVETVVVHTREFLPVGRVSRGNPPASTEIPSSSRDVPVLTQIPIRKVGELESRPEHDGRLSDSDYDIAGHDQDEENLQLHRFITEINHKLQEVLNCFGALVNAMLNPYSRQESIDGYRNKIHECARVLTELKSALPHDPQRNRIDLAPMIQGLPVEIVFLIAGDYSSFAEDAKKPEDQDMEKSVSEVCKVMKQFMDRDTYNALHHCSLILGGINDKQGPQLFAHITELLTKLKPFGLKGIAGKFFNYTIITRLTRVLPEIPTDHLAGNSEAISMFFNFLLSANNLSLVRLQGLESQLLFMFNTVWDRSELLKNTLLQMMTCSSAEGLKKVYNFLRNGYPDSEFMLKLRAMANTQQVQQPLLRQPVVQPFNPNPPIVLIPAPGFLPFGFMYQ